MRRRPIHRDHARAAHPGFAIADTSEGQARHVARSVRIPRRSSRSLAGIEICALVAAPPRAPIPATPPAAAVTAPAKSAAAGTDTADKAPVRAEILDGSMSLRRKLRR